jgi:endoglucanase
MPRFWKQSYFGPGVALLALTLTACTAGELGMPNYAPAPAAKATVGPTPALGKCLNLANTLEPPNEGDWGPGFRDEDAGIIRSGGFSTVRVPINFIGHALATPPYTMDANFMARARDVIDTLRAAGLNVIVEQHNNEDLSAAPDANRDRSAAVWRQVAAALRDEPANVWFELLNEPHDRLTNANLLATLTPSLAAIRETNPTRAVVIGGEHWSAVDSLATLPLPDDPYIVATFHYYDPFEFTHQGAAFIHPTPPLGRRFGSAADAAQLQDNLAKVRAFMARTGRVPFAGEYGAIENIPSEQRAAWYRTVSSAFASAGVASCAWGYRNTFPLWRDGKWLPEMPGIAAPQ